MKKLVFCCLLILLFMACGERNAIAGRWAMEIEGTTENFIKMPDDSIVSPELRFEYDTIYMDVRSDGTVVKSECLGIYSIEDDLIKVTDRYGKQLLCRFDVKDNVLTIVDREDPKKILMRLKRIKGVG